MLKQRGCRRMQLFHETHCLVSYLPPATGSVFKVRVNSQYQPVRYFSSEIKLPIQGQKRNTRQTQCSLFLLVVNSKTHATLLWGSQSLILLEIKHLHEVLKTQNFNTNTHRFTVSLQSCCKYSGFGKAQNSVWAELGRKPRVDISSYSSVKPYAPNYGSTRSSQGNNEFSIKHKEKQKACEDFTIRTYFTPRHLAWHHFIWQRRWWCSGTSSGKNVRASTTGCE